MSMILGYIKEREISFLFFLLLVLLVIVLWNLYKKEKKRAEAAELSVAGERKYIYLRSCYYFPSLEVYFPCHRQTQS